MAISLIISHALILLSMFCFGHRTLPEIQGEISLVRLKKCMTVIFAPEGLMMVAGAFMSPG